MLNKIPAAMAARAKTSAPRSTSPVGDSAKNTASASPSTDSKPSHNHHQQHQHVPLQRKKSVDEQNEDTTDDSAPLAAQVETFRPELLPLLHPSSVAELAQQHWALERVADAVKLSHILQDRLLLLPELNRTSPCYSARSIVLLYTKLKYLETFPAPELAEYAAKGDTEYDEVRLLHQLARVASPAELVARLAAMLHIPSRGDVWTEILKFVTRALPFAEPTESLLVRGSDERSLLCAVTKTNKYNGSVVPAGPTAAAAAVARASCTCSSISLAGFAKCEKLRQELLLNALSINPNAQSATAMFDAKMANVRARVATALGVTSLVRDDALRVLLTPSGTDAELLATAAALARVFAGLEVRGGSSVRKVTSIVTAHGEIGRGSSAASGGKHFSDLTPSGEAVVPGESLRRFPTDLVEVLELTGRDDTGAIRCVDDVVAETVTRLLADPNGSNVVLLHVVMGSKTGFGSPSLAVADALAAAHPNRLLVVIDACQMRLSLSAFRAFSARGYLTLVTGSKFFGGAPFCGAVLMPMRCVYELETAAVEQSAELCLPPGLADYFSQYDLPANMPNVRARVGAFLNVGLLLRWESALANMEPYARIPEHAILQICATYVAHTKQQLAKYGALFEVLEAPPVASATSAATATAPIAARQAVASPSSDECRRELDDDANDSDTDDDTDAHTSISSESIAPMDSIVSFKVWDDRRHEHLDTARMRDLHTLLSKDLSIVLPHDDVAKHKCLLGQPVQLGKQHGAVVRIALGAEMVNAAYYRGRREGVATVLDEFVAQDALVLRKTALILQHWELLQQTVLEERASPPLVELPKPLADWNFSAKTPEIARAVAQLVADRIVGGDLDQSSKLALVYDLDAIDLAFQALRTSFPAHFEHRFAVKSCPLAFFLRRAIENGVGLECASVIEVQHALRLGCAPSKIVFDSPCKTRRDIAFALSAGVEVNADNFDELEIIRAHAEELFQSNFPECTPRFAGHLPRIGLRVNPLLGAGANAVLSVSTVHSKFGVPLTAANRSRIVEFFRANPWMSGLHCHVGSQGCTLEMLARGGAMLSDLANEIDAAAGASRVKVINIGGGLPSNYDSDDVAPTFAAYVDVLRAHAPHLFERNGRTVLTEFGRSVSSKTGWTISEVEYVKQHEVVANISSVSPLPVQPSQTAIIHAGSDLFVRTCYVPALFPHRMSVFTANGIASTAPVATQNVAGPLCFGGDVIGRNVSLPTIARGDFVVIHDTGSNTIALFSRHCSRPAPAVYGYRSSSDDISVELLKPAETPEEVMRFWG